jgi:hypothetical protein
MDHVFTGLVALLGERRDQGHALLEPVDCLENAARVAGGLGKQLTACGRSSAPWRVSALSAQRAASVWEAAPALPARRGTLMPWRASLR